MKRALAPAVAAFVVTGFLPAAGAAEYYDTARVVASTPVYERVSMPRQECWNEVVTVTEYRTETAPRAESRSPVGAIIGGVAGGIIGNQVGHGGGRAAATAIGAVTGAVVGDRLDNDRRPPPGYVVAEPAQRTVQRCRNVDEVRDEVRGYDVTYRYNGRDFTVRMPYDPGPEVRVSVSVVPEQAGYRR